MYNDDLIPPGVLRVSLVTSPYAHAWIKGIDTQDALRTPGVLAVITGDYYQVLCGPLIEDRPPIARGKVRYFGEPVAAVVAHSEP